MKDNVSARPHRLIAKQRMVRWIWTLFRFGIIVGVSYVILYPLFVKISVALMSRSDMYDMTVKWIPRSVTAENFQTVLDLVDYGTYFFNTLLTSSLATVLQLFSCTLAAYGFARFQFRGKNPLFFLVILTLVIPPQTYMVTTYMQYRFFDGYGVLGLFGMGSVGSLINTPWPLILMSLGCQALKNGLFIYVLRNFFAKLPGELEEAAWVDGAGVMRIFTSVMLPNAGPAITTVTVLSFVWTWNDLYTVSTFMPGMKLFPTLLNTISFSIQQAVGGASVIDTVQLSMLTNAATLLIIAPLLVFFLITQRFFVEGVARTGITGM